MERVREVLPVVFEKMEELCYCGHVADAMECGITSVTFLVVRAAQVGRCLG